MVLAKAIVLAMSMAMASMPKAMALAMAMTTPKALAMAVAKSMTHGRKCIGDPCMLRLTALAKALPIFSYRGALILASSWGELHFCLISTLKVDFFFSPYHPDIILSCGAREDYFASSS